VHRARFAIALVVTVAALSSSPSPARAEGEVHDGFQFRGAVGFGYLSDTGSNQASLHGWAPALEVYLGGTPVRGLAIGGFLNGASAIGPSATFNGTTVNFGTTDLTLVTLGPYIDYYPNPRKGFHILGTLGFARLTASYNDGGFAASDSATGFTVGGGIGYDWWVGRDWSIGILGRFTFADTSRNVGPVSVSDSTVLPSVLFSFSYN
jgi:hypothetical protein